LAESIDLAVDRIVNFGHPRHIAEHGNGHSNLHLASPMKEREKERKKKKKRN